MAATAYNLQDCCSDLIFFDVPSNSQTKLQAGGRLIRLGQRRRVLVWTLPVDHTYDQSLQAKATQKMVGIIAGQANLTLTEDDCAVAARDLQDDDTAMEYEEVVEEDARRGRTLALKAAGYHRETFGERSSRWRWDNLKDLTAKDLFSEKFTFHALRKLPEDRCLWPLQWKKEESKCLLPLPWPIANAPQSAEGNGG